MLENEILGLEQYKLVVSTLFILEKDSKAMDFKCRYTKAMKKNGSKMLQKGYLSNLRQINQTVSDDKKYKVKIQNDLYHIKLNYFAE